MDRGMNSTPDLRALLAAAAAGKSRNPRAKFWAQVCRMYPLSELPSTERLALVKLSEGHGWLDNISEELNAEYDRKFDTVDGRQSAFAAAVHKDITRTFGIFGAELRAMGSRRPGPGVFEAQLERLLLATTHECEYCQGMNFVGATLILEEYNVKDAFAIFMFAMKERHLNILYSSDSSSLPDYISIYDKLLRRYNPRVHEHFHSIGFLPIMYAIEWFTTLFSVSTPKRLTTYLYDLFLAGFDDIMIRVGLAVVQVLEHEVLKRGAEELQMEFKLLVRKLRPAQVFPLALAYKVHPTLDVLATIYHRMSSPRHDPQGSEQMPIEFEIDEAISADKSDDKLIQEITSPTLRDMLGKVEYCVFNCAGHVHTPSCAFSAVGELLEPGRSHSVPSATFAELGIGHGHARKSTMKGFFKNLFEDIPTKKDISRIRSEPVMSMIDGVRVLDPVTKQFCPKREGWLPQVIPDYFSNPERPSLPSIVDELERNSEGSTATTEAAERREDHTDQEPKAVQAEAAQPADGEPSEKEKDSLPIVPTVGCE